MKRSFLAICLPLLLLAGCTQFDYVGQKFAATPLTEPVAYYLERSQVPPGEYRIIGRVTVTAPEGTDGYDIMDLLLAKARSYGANAVCLVSSKVTTVGTYEIENAQMSGPNQPYDPGNITASGAPIEINTFGEQTSLGGEVMRRQEVVVKALFLKNKAELDQLLKERSEELELLLGKGRDPAAPASENRTLDLSAALGLPPESDRGDEVSSSSENTQTDTEELNSPDTVDAGSVEQNAEKVESATPEINSAPEKESELRVVSESASVEENPGKQEEPEKQDAVQP